MGGNVKTAKNQDKPAQQATRQAYFDWLALEMAAKHFLARIAQHLSRL
jgi:hypothetical protein